MKTAFVNGATGLVGQHLVEYLSHQGIQVFALSRSPADSTIKDKWSILGVTEVVLQLADYDQLVDILAYSKYTVIGRSVFYHTAWGGEKSLTDGGIEKQMDNVKLAAKAIITANAIGCDTFVNVGSSQEVFLEEDLLMPSEISQSDYAIAKIAARDICLLLGYLNKINTVHTRLSVPIDPSLTRGGFIVNMLKRIIDGEPVDTIQNKQLFDLTLLPDVSRALYMIGCYAKNRSDYYIGTGQFKTLQEHFNYFKTKKVNNNESDKRSPPNQRLSVREIKKDLGFQAQLNLLSIYEGIR